jgi:PHD/YefM family antitoxin component YafN of YafNO toxin-antitoxin module
MLVETENIVPVETFRKEIGKFIAAARGGRGPVAITQDSAIVGFFVSPDDYNAMFGAAVKELLESRQHRPTLSHESARSRVMAAARRK